MVNFRRIKSKDIQNNLGISKKEFLNIVKGEDGLGLDGRKFKNQNDVFRKLRTQLGLRGEFEDPRVLRKATRTKPRRVIELEETPISSLESQQNFFEKTLNPEITSVYDRIILDFYSEVNTAPNENVKSVLPPPESDLDFKYLISKIYQSPNHKMLIAVETAKRRKYFTLSQKFINVLNGFEIQNRNIIASEEFEGGEGSDAYLYNELTTEEIVKIEIIAVPLKKNAQAKLSLKNRGDFFKYTHRTPLNLCRYQIYKNIEEIPKDDDPCLIHTLCESGLFTESEIGRLRKEIKTENFPECRIKDLAEKYDFGYSMRLLNCQGASYLKTEFDKENSRYVKICLLAGHYFIYDEKTEITSYALRNFRELQEEDRWYVISGLGKQGNFKREPKKCINSFTLVHKLLMDKENYLSPISCEDFQKNRVVKEDDSDDLEYIEKEIKQIGFRKPEKDFSDREKYDLIFFDTETITLKNDGTPADKHIPYQIVSSVNDEKKKRCFEGNFCVLEFLQSIKEDSILICHNLKYDSSFLYPYLFQINECTRGGRVITIDAKFYNKLLDRTYKLNFKDSYNMISVPLRNFPGMFKMEGTQKEVMPYGSYIEENLYSGTKYKKWHSITAARKFIEKRTDYALFRRNVEKLGLASKKKEFFKIWEYSRYYCEQDVEILKFGYLKFREWVKIITGLDILNYATISSIGYAYATKEGCFEGCYQLGGNPRRFIMKCIVGGRCMLKNNQMVRILALIQDFDGVSLYPSAMKRLAELLGVLKGFPKILPENSTYEDLKKFDGYFVKINVTKIGKERGFPLLSRKNEFGVREFRNDLTGIHYVDKVTLEDLIEFQKIEFEVLSGYYFDDGRNSKVGKVIQHLFDTRKREKANGNPIQLTYKLLMNSIYGKSLLKYDPVETRILNNESDTLRFLVNNYDEHIETVKIDNCGKHIVKTNKLIDDHMNFPQFGCEVLSMSKRIMNEVMCLAEDIGVEIYYQDTDSMHMKADGLEKLRVSFFEKYKRELSGDELGQFNCDFDFKTDKGTIPCSREFIGLGKKSYYDSVVTYEKGAIKYNDHFRMKGISQDAVRDKVKKDGQSIRDLFFDLYEGHEKEFDLLCTKIRFKHEKNKTVHNVGEFKRKVYF